MANRLERFLNTNVGKTFLKLAPMTLITELTFDEGARDSIIRVDPNKSTTYDAATGTYTIQDGENEVFRIIDPATGRFRGGFNATDNPTGKLTRVEGVMDGISILGQVNIGTISRRFDRLGLLVKYRDK